MANLQRILKRQPVVDEAEFEAVRARVLVRLAAMNHLAGQDEDDAAEPDPVAGEAPTAAGPTFGIGQESPDGPRRDDPEVASDGPGPVGVPVMVGSAPPRPAVPVMIHVAGVAAPIGDHRDDPPAAADGGERRKLVSFARPAGIALSAPVMTEVHRPSDAPESVVLEPPVVAEAPVAEASVVAEPPIMVVRDAPVMPDAQVVPDAVVVTVSPAPRTARRNGTGAKTSVVTDHPVGEAEARPAVDEPPQGAPEAPILVERSDPATATRPVRPRRRTKALAGDPLGSTVAATAAVAEVPVGTNGTSASTPVIASEPLEGPVQVAGPLVDGEPGDSPRDPTAEAADALVAAPLVDGDVDPSPSASAPETPIALIEEPSGSPVGGPSDPVESVILLGVPTAPPVRGASSKSAGRTSKPPETGAGPTSGKPRPAARSTPGRPEAVELAAYCPYCATPLDPPPDATRRCLQCRQKIVVRRVGPRTVYLVEAALPVFEAERRRAADAERWSHERGRWLDLALKAGAPLDRVTRSRREPLSEAGTAAARALYLATVDRAFRTAKSERRWEDAARIRTDQAQALYRVAGVSSAPPDEVVRYHREGLAALLNGIGEVARDAELRSGGCCETCQADHGLSVRIADELRSPRLPHPGCPRGLCRCRWTMAARDQEFLAEFLRRQARLNRRQRSTPADD